MRFRIKGETPRCATKRNIQTHTVDRMERVTIEIMPFYVHLFYHFDNDNYCVRRDMQR